MGKLKGINQKNLYKFNNFICLFRGGFYFMDCNISFNPYMVCPVCKALCNNSLVKKVIYFVSDRFAFCPKLFKGAFKDTSAAAYHNRWAFLKPKDLLKVFIKYLEIIRKRLVGVRLRGLWPVFKNFNERKGRSVLKIFKGFLNILVIGKGCFYLCKYYLLAVRAFAKAMGMNKLVGFACKGYFFNVFVSIKAGDSKSTFIIAGRASELNSNQNLIPLKGV